MKNGLKQDLRVKYFVHLTEPGVIHSFSFKGAVDSVPLNIVDLYDDGTLFNLRKTLGDNLVKNINPKPDGTFHDHFEINVFITPLEVES